MTDGTRWIKDKHVQPRDDHAHEMSRYCHCRPELSALKMEPGPFDIAGTTVARIVVKHNALMNGSKGNRRRGPK